MIKLITREKLEYTARKVLGYPLHDAEKDYFLALAMNSLSKSALNKKLVFKGGTAIYHCYLDQLRFSEDLDFTAIEKEIDLDEVSNSLLIDDVFEVKKSFVSNATIKLERLKYDAILETPNSIKVEIDKLQNVYLPPLLQRYRNVWGMDFEVLTMNPVEICAEKIRACNERFRYRDFYDLYMLVTELKLDVNESIKILPNKEVRKDIVKSNILKNLENALVEVSSKSDTVYYKKEISNEELKMFFEDLKIPSIKCNIHNLDF